MIAQLSHQSAEGEETTVHAGQSPLSTLSKITDTYSLSLETDKDIRQKIRLNTRVFS